jgi:hypothetical protein
MEGRRLSLDRSVNNPSRDHTLTPASGSTQIDLKAAAHMNGIASCTLSSDQDRVMLSTLRVQGRTHQYVLQPVNEPMSILRDEFLADSSQKPQIHQEGRCQRNLPYTEVVFLDIGWTKIRDFRIAPGSYVGSPQLLHWGFV